MEKIAFWGKIPASAEFVGRGLSSDMRDLLAEWIGNLLVQKNSALAGSDTGNERAWRFYIAPELAQGISLMGVMLRSTDAVGREYPLVLVHGSSTAATDLLMQADITGWFDRMAEIAEGVVVRQLSAEQIEVLLDRQPALAGMAEKNDSLLTRRIVQEWGQVRDIAPYTLPTPSAISFFARNLAVLGVERLLVGCSVWWRKSIDGQGCELLHMNRLPQAQDFNGTDAPW